MKLFLDTANLDEIREAASWGIIDVTILAFNRLVPSSKAKKSANSSPLR